MELANIVDRCTFSWGLEGGPQWSILLTLRARKQLLVPLMNSHLDDLGTGFITRQNPP